ncbi:MAG TPA: hypothetical protein VKX40_10260, partial [Aequorivita sp.]|nr:hypothetical protein [Aequorivita sp.]
SDFIIFTSVVLGNTNLSEYYTAAKLYPIRFCSIFFRRLADIRSYREVLGIWGLVNWLIRDWSLVLRGFHAEDAEGKLEVRAWKCEVRSTKWETKHDVLKDEVESWSLLFVFWNLVLGVGRLSVP